jgi:hypothetical protein
MAIRIRIRTNRIRIEFFVFSKIRIRRIEYSNTPDQKKRRTPLRDLQRFCGLANSTSLAVSDARLYLRTLLNCASDQRPGKAVVLCHQSLRDLKRWEDLPLNTHRGRAIWEPTPQALLITDTSMEGWGAIWHKPKGPSTPHQAPPQSLTANTHISVPARGLFLATDAGPQSINQREILTAILGLRSFLRLSQKNPRPIDLRLSGNPCHHTKLDLKVPQNSELRRILRRMCEENGLSLGLQYLPSILNTWADRLSRRND